MRQTKQHCTCGSEIDVRGNKALGEALASVFWAFHSGEGHGSCAPAVAKQARYRANLAAAKG